VNLPRLLRTTAFRLALRYALVYVCLMGLFLVALFWSSHRYIDSQKAAGLAQELDALVQKFESGGRPRLAAEVSEREEHRLKKGRYYLLVGPDGARIAGNLLAWPSDSHVPVDGKVHSIWLEDSVIPGAQHDDDAYGPVIARQLPDGSRLLLARNIRHMEDLEDITLYLTPVILIVAALLALAMGVTLGRTILGRMDAISRTAGEIMGGDLSRRIQVGDRNDEFNALARRLNAMLERVQHLITGMREVTDNVAHDLRSPLSRLRNRLEVTLLERRSEAEYRQAIRRSVEDTESLIETRSTQVAYDESIDMDTSRLDGGGGINPDYLPRDPDNGCQPVYPNQFVRVNNIFEVVKAAHGYTAWADKHPAYQFTQGRSGQGVDDLYAPEIASVPLPVPASQLDPGVMDCTSLPDPGVATGDDSWTDSFTNIRCYDSLKVQAVLNEIDGYNHDRTAKAPRPCSA
jgi:HAMP domain-containing protein